MKLGLLLLATLPIAAYAQDSTAVNSSSEYPNTFSSGSANVQRFDNKARRFKAGQMCRGRSNRNRLA